MRPVLRGPRPTKNGAPVVFKKYGEARDFLIAAVGDYCSYCEMPCKQGPEVEHVRPKSLDPALLLEWDNFLLGCKPCNTVKGNTPVALGDFYWPDRDNTLRAFAYDPDRAPHLADGLTPAQRLSAQRTLTLTGIDREPGGVSAPSPRDRRWLIRKEAWDRAHRSRDNLDRRDLPEMREQIVLTAISTGFFSVWMRAFETDQDMRQRFIVAFTGTANDCFDANTNLLPRQGGAL